MKNLFYYSIIVLACFTVNNKTFAQANTSLSNLTSPTKVNVNLLPDNNNKRNLGSATKSWKNLYLDSAVYLRGARFLAAPYIETNTAVGIGTLFSNATGHENTANGYGALYYNITGEQNTAIGYHALYFNTTGNYNTANGREALNSNTTGDWNTATGDFALSSNTTGGSNSANGWGALHSNTTGYRNTATGYAALYSNTTGLFNSALGYGALYWNATGSYNSALGYGALQYNLTGDDNSAFGFSALLDNRTGKDNSAFGFYALSYTTGDANSAFGSYALRFNEGYQNSAFGYSALFSSKGNNNVGIGTNSLYNTSYAEFNTAVGYNSGYSYDNGYNNVFLGANTDVTGDGFYNVIAIGQGTVCTDVSQVTMGNGATATYRAYANWTNISDGRFKKNIKENVPGLEFINKLKPITYTLDATGIDNFLHKDLPQDKQTSEKAKAVMNKAFAEKEKVVYTGFVAQDVEKAAKSLNYDFSGVDAAKNNKDLYGLRYAEFVVPLVKAVQELSSENSKLKSQTDEQQNINANLQKQIDELKAMMVSSQSTVNSQSSTVSFASLEQNIPNPFTHTTNIRYSLNQKFTTAQIVITDKSGKTIKGIDVSGTGKGSVNIDAATLSSGAYQYSLYVDGKMIDSKQMVHIK